VTERIALTPKLLSDVSEYLEEIARDLEQCHYSPSAKKVEPPEVAAEVKRVKAWASKLRRAALQELTS